MQHQGCQEADHSVLSVLRLHLLWHFYSVAKMADLNDHELRLRWHGCFISKGKRKPHNCVSLALKAKTKDINVICDTKSDVQSNSDVFQGSFHWALIDLFFDRRMQYSWHHYWHPDSKQHQGMNRPGVRQVPDGSGEQGKMEETGCKIICGAQTTFAVKGLMMMMRFQAIH